MTPLTQAQRAAQLVAQLRTFDPSVSAEIGTPERLMLDTVAQGLTEAQVDVNLLEGALDLDSKYGADLDNFVGLFGFGRQSGATATGFVNFSRPTASPYNITVPNGTQVQAIVTATNDTIQTTITSAVIFQTTAAVTLVAGQTSVTAPLQAVLAGTRGNVAANTITQFANIGSPVLGITSVNNPLPTGNGSDKESDAELKVRFRNTVFRNLAGTADQYMALAVSTQFTTKANVLGPISRYQEYVQLPWVDDSQGEAPTVTITAAATNGSPTLSSVVVTPPGTPGIDQIISGTGIPSGTTILDIDTAGTTYTLSANYTGLTGSGTFVVTTGEPAEPSGGGIAGQWTTLPSGNTYAKYIYLDVPHFVSNGAVGTNTVFYRQDTDFALNAPPLNAGDTHREFSETPPDLPDPATIPYQPNVTFFNVYTGGDAAVTAPRPNDIVLLEYSYLSSESRNDVSRSITNCVDVYVNGENPTTADAVVPPIPGGINLFTANAIDKFYYLNFRRIGEPDVPPVVGNIFTGLFWQPVIGLPSQIVAGTNTYLLGTHYWAVEDKTLIGNTVRTRNGIEWSPTLNGQAAGDPTEGPYTGVPIISAGVSSLTIGGYIYDQNIVMLQAALDKNKQVTTDVLAHRATRRYFKLDITVVYGAGVSISGTNTLIQAAVQGFFDGQYFGSVVQLSDLMALIRNVSGVQNVRWSDDVIHPADDASNTLNRVTECDVGGNPRGATFTGTATNASTSVTGVVIASGVPAKGQTVTAAGFPVGTTLDNIVGTTYTLSEPYSGTTGSLPFVTEVVFNTDFSFRDNELPLLAVNAIAGDTVPGMIIRPRAQGAFTVV